MGIEALDDQENNFVMEDDGSVTFPDEKEVVQPGGFMENLAVSMPASQLSAIATDLVTLIEQDKKSREKRDAQYAEGLRRTGLGNDAPGGADFPGASKVVHPVLAEACVDYASAAIKALFPSDGPVKMHQIDKGAKADFDRAERKRDFMNWQLTEQMPEYRSELEVLLTQQPLGGSQYLKLWFDADKNRPCAEFVSVDYVYLPFSANSFMSASRRTIVVPLNSMEFRRRIDSGMYRDAAYGSSPDIEESSAAEANDRIEGKEASGFNEDGLRFILEVYTWLEIEEDKLLPYIVSIDEQSQTILSIYRNWEEDDEDYEELQWVVEFPFIPWRGAYGIGLIHLIGGMAGAATGALRALLDSAHVNNLPGGVKLKSSRDSGTTKSYTATEVVEIEAPPNVDDIRKTIMPWPVKEPSATLLQLLGIVVETAKGVVSTAEERISDVGTNTPVGTTMALVEQGSKTFSAIHLRLHTSQAKVLRILQRLNATNSSERAQQKKFGRVLVTQQDFLTPDDILPVSDPNIFSETQRYAQVQGLQQMATDQTVPWNKIVIYRRMMAIMRVENPDEILPMPPEPFSGDPVQEIVMAMTGKPIAVTPDLPHMIHIQEELAFLLDPVFGAANPSLVNPGFQVILNDITQHLFYLYQQIKMQVQQAAVSRVLGGIMQQLIASGALSEEAPQIAEIAQQQLANPQVQAMVKAAAAEQYAQANQQLAPLVAQMQQATQLVSKQTPPPQVPPEVQIQAQAMQAETQRKSAYDQAKLQLETQKVQATLANDAALTQLRQQEAALHQQEIARRLEMEANDRQFEQKLETYRVQIKEQMEALANQINLQKNREDNQQHQQTEIAKNHEDNMTAVFMEQMRQEGLQNRAELDIRFKEMSERMDQMVRLAIEEASAERNKSTEEKK